MPARFAVAVVRPVARMGLHYRDRVFIDDGLLCSSHEDEEIGIIRCCFKVRIIGLSIARKRRAGSILLEIAGLREFS